MEATGASQHSAVRAPGREHVPIYPHNFVAVRFVQLALAVIILGLAAFGIWAVAFDGDIFIMVVAIMTLITSIYHVVCEYAAPNVYNYWAVLALDIFLIIMWLASFALLASDVSQLFSYGNRWGLTTLEHAVLSCLAAASALGGVQFALHVLSLVFHSIALHRHRAAGLHCNPVGSGGAPAPAVTGVPVAAPVQEKPQNEYQNIAPQPTPSPAPTQMQPYPVQPQQGYPVQVQPQQQPFPVQQQPQQPYPAQAQPQQYYPQQVQPGQIPANNFQPAPQ